MFWRNLIPAIVSAILYLGCEAPPPDGRTVFLTIGCTRCHGDEGEGASLGPPLEALSTKFNAAQLDQFLDNPLAYLERDTRLQKWRERYFTPMPKLQMSQQQRQVLAAYLFQKHP